MVVRSRAAGGRAIATGDVKPLLIQRVKSAFSG